MTAVAALPSIAGGTVAVESLPPATVDAEAVRKLVSKLTTKNAAE